MLLHLRQRLRHRLDVLVSPGLGGDAGQMLLDGGAQLKNLLDFGAVE